MNEIPLTLWPNNQTWSDNHKLYAFSDMETINKPVTQPKDYALSLKQVTGSMYDYNKQIVAATRNSTNDGWLAVCVDAE